MIKLAIGVSVLLINITAAYPAMLQCQTNESRGLRLTAFAMAKAAAESDPWRECGGGGGCSMQSSVADSMIITQRRFEAESKAALYKARAAEAAKCPQWADAIMEGIDIADDMSAVIAAYEEAMQKEYLRLDEMKAWQKEHPQCKHVEWAVYSGICTNGDCRNTTTEYSPEDFSGKYRGKAGLCSASGKGPSWRGTEESLDSYDPDKNDRISKVRCANALQAAKLYDGWYADPKFCRPR